jgi:hypothetical protein
MDVLLDALGYQSRQPHQEDVFTSSTDAHEELLAVDPASRSWLLTFCRSPFWAVLIEAFGFLAGRITHVGSTAPSQN